MKYVDGNRMCESLLPALRTIKWTKEGKIAWVILNRPRVLNAVNNQATLDLGRIASALAKDDDIRVVIISGAGRAFCTGIDLKQLSSNLIDARYYARWERALRIFETMPKIVLAAIKEYCLGGGLQLALACDVRIAATNAILGLPAVREALVPGMSTWRLARYVGLGRAKRYVLSGENISAEDAMKMGLVDYVVPLSQFDRRVKEIARHYVKMCSVSAIESKLLLNRCLDLEYETFLEDYLSSQKIATSSDDHREARRAYLQNRDPVFK